MSKYKTKKGKMEFFLDVDGVILDFESSFMDFVRDHYLPDLPQNYYPKSWEMNEEFEELDIEEVWERFVNNNRFTQLDLLIEAESFNELSKNHPIYLITNLPHDQFISRQQNLDHHNLKYQGLHLAGHFNFGDEHYPVKSAVIAKLRDPEKRLIFLDDHPKNCQDVKNSFPESDVFLMSRPHNEKAVVEDWIRVDDWNEFLDKAM